MGINATHFQTYISPNLEETPSETKLPQLSLQLVATKISVFLFVRFLLLGSTDDVNSQEQCCQQAVHGADRLTSTVP